jgi:hypothetical protein
MVHKLRDLGDKVTGETEMGYSMGELMKTDPNWDRQRFGEEFEEDFIPLVITAFLKPDIKTLQKLTEDNVRPSYHITLSRQRVTYDELTLSSVLLLN